MVAKNKRRSHSKIVVKIIDSTWRNSTTKITITKADPVWGIVGDACLNGWGAAEDVKLNPDPCNEGVYIVYGVVLKDGAMKFRADDDWGVNLGGSDGTLSAGGANISVSAGTYDITLDAVNLTYIILKK